MKYYTIGEIFRLGLLKNHEGSPYKDKATVGRVVGKLKYVEKKTPWGMSKQISDEEIEKHNNSF